MIKISDCTIVRSDGGTDAGFKISLGTTEASFIKADGLEVGSLTACQDASAAILTAGCNELIYALTDAVKEGKLKKLTKMFFMLSTDGSVLNSIINYNSTSD